MRGNSVDTDASEPPDRRRVLIVTDSLAMGGMERQLTLLAKSLPATWRARVFSLREGPYAAILRAAGVELSILPRQFSLDARPAFLLARLIREWRPTIVHTYGYMSTAMSLLPCRMAAVPLVDGSIRQGAGPSARGWLRRAMISQADVVIANSQAGFDAWGVDTRRGRVIHNGFDPDRWALCVIKHSAPPPTTVVMTARMNPAKDFSCLLDAARVLHSEDPNGWRFLAVGSGEERPALLSEYKDLLESGVVAFPDVGTEVLSLVSGAHIGVLLTDPAFAVEGLPNSIMEYMACGLPDVCTESGGNGELVLDGRTGLFVPPSDVDAVVQRLRFLSQNPATASRMGRAGRSRIASVFTVERLVAETIEAYDLALHAGPRRGAGESTRGGESPEQEA
jgi:glycosyltransferase involved in cell wall biosynthesis